MCVSTRAAGGWGGGGRRGGDSVRPSCVTRDTPPVLALRPYHLPRHLPPFLGPRLSCARPAGMCTILLVTKCVLLRKTVFFSFLQPHEPRTRTRTHRVTRGVKEMERNEEEGERGREEARLPSPTRTHTDSSDIPTSIFLNSHSRAHTHTHTRHPRIHIHRNSHYACTCAQVRLGNYRKLELGRYLTTQRVAVELLITLGLVRPEEWERLFCKCAIPTPAFLRPPRLGRRLTRPHLWYAHCVCV